MDFQPFQEPGSQEPQGPFPGPPDPGADAQFAELALQKAGSGAWHFNADGTFPEGLTSLLDQIQHPKVRQLATDRAKDWVAMQSLTPEIRSQLWTILRGPGEFPGTFAGSKELAEKFATKDFLQPFDSLYQGIGGRVTGAVIAGASAIFGAEDDSLQDYLRWARETPLTERYQQSVMVPALRAALEAQATPEQQAALRHLRSRAGGTEKHLDGLIYQTIQEAIAEEAGDYSFSFQAWQALNRNAGHLAVLGTGYGAGAALATKSAQGYLAVGRLAKLAAAAPRAAGVFREGMRLAGAGTIMGGLEAIQPLSAEERAFVAQAEDPEAVRDALMISRFVEGVVSAPIMEAAGGIGHELSASILGRTSLLAGAPGLGRRFAAAGVGSGATGIALTFGPVFNSAVSPEQRADAYDLVARAVRGEATREEIMAHAANFVGGMWAPFAALGLAHSLRAVPKLDPESQRFYDRFTADLKESIPQELRWLYGLREPEIATRANLLLQDNLLRPVQAVRDSARAEMKKGDGWEERVRAQIGTADQPLAGQILDLGLAWAKGEISPRHWADSGPADRWRQAMARWTAAASAAKIAEERAAGRLPREGLPPGQATAALGAGRPGAMPALPAPNMPTIAMGGEEGTPPPERYRDNYPAALQAVLIGQRPEHRDAVQREMLGNGTDRLLEKWRRGQITAPEFEDAAADIHSRIVAGLEDAKAESGAPLRPDQAEALAWQALDLEATARRREGQLPDGVPEATFRAQILRRLLPALAADPATKAIVGDLVRRRRPALEALLDQEAAELPAMDRRFFQPDKDPAEVAEARERAMAALAEGWTSKLQELVQPPPVKPAVEQAKPRQEEKSAGREGQEKPAEQTGPAIPATPKESVSRETPAAQELAKNDARKIAIDIVATEHPTEPIRELHRAVFVQEIPVGGGEIVRKGFVPVADLKTHPKLQPRNEAAGLTASGPFGTDRTKVAGYARWWDWTKLQDIVVVHMEKPPSTEWEQGWQGPGWYVVNGHHRYAAARLRTDSQFASQWGFTLAPDARPVESLPARLHILGRAGEPDITKILEMSAAENIARSKMNVLQEAAALAAQVKAGRDVAQVAMGFGWEPGRGQAMLQIDRLVKDAPTIQGLVIDQKALGDPADDGAFQTLRLLASRHAQDAELYPAKLLSQTLEIASRKRMARGQIEAMLNQWEVAAKLARETKTAEEAPALPGMEEVVSGQRLHLEIIAEVAKSQTRVETARGKLVTAERQIAALHAETPDQAQAHAVTLAGIQAELKNAEKLSEAWKIANALISRRGLETELLAELAAGSGMRVGAQGQIERTIGKRAAKPDWQKVDVVLRKLSDQMRTYTHPLEIPKEKHEPETPETDIGAVARGGSKSAAPIGATGGGEPGRGGVERTPSGAGEIARGSRVVVAGKRQGVVIDFTGEGAERRAVIEFPNEPNLTGEPAREALSHDAFHVVEEIKPETPKESPNRLFTEEDLQDGLKKIRAAGTPPAMKLVDAKARLEQLRLDSAASDAAMGQKKPGSLAAKRAEAKAKRLRERLAGVEEEVAGLEQAVQKAGPEAGIVYLYAGIDTGLLEGLLKVGGYYVEKGARDFQSWLKEMHGRLKTELPGMEPQAFDAYLRSVWNGLVQKPEFAEYELRPVAAKHFLTRKQRGQPADDLDVELKTDAQRPHKEGDPDPPAQRLGIEEQLEAARRYEIERAQQGLGPRDDNLPGRTPILYDEYDGTFPDPSRVGIEHPSWKMLVPHQVFGAKAILAAWEREPVFVLADGTGTGKTWTTLVAALERRRQVGGKILVITSGRTAIASWKDKDFPLLGVTEKPVSVRQLDKGDLAMTIWHSFQPQNLDKAKLMLQAVQRGEIKTIIADESHAIRNWGKNTPQALHAIHFFEDAIKAGAKVVFASATPAESALHMRYLAGSFLENPTDEGFAAWLESIGYTRKGKGSQSFAEDPRKQDLMIASLIATRGEMGERGVMLNRELSYEGVDVDFGRVELTEPQFKQWETIGEAFDLLDEVIGLSGLRGLQRLVGAWYANTMHRYAEDWYIPEAVRWARWWHEQGGRVVVLAETRSEAAEERIQRALEKPRGAEGLSIIDRASLKMQHDPLYRARVMETARKLDEQMGAPPATLTKILAALQKEVAGIRTAEISGAKVISVRADVVKKWRQNELDVIAATRQTAGESISLQDEAGRPVLGLMLGTPWTAQDVTQSTGRFHRLVQATTPRIVYLIADGIPSEAMRAERVGNRLASLRATVRGVQTTPQTLEKALDAAAFFLGAMGRERAQIQGLRSDLEMLQRRRARQVTAETPVAAIRPEEIGSLPPAVPVQAAETPAPEAPAGATSRQSLHNPPSTWKAWQAHVGQSIDLLTGKGADLEKLVPLPGPTDAAFLAAAMSRLGHWLDAPGAKGHEAEARDFIAKRLHKAVTEGVDLGPEAAGLPGQKGRRQGGFLDLDLLAAPVKLAWKLEPVHNLLYALFDGALKDGAQAEERFAMPPKLNRRMWQVQHYLWSPENILGYRVTEPFTRALADAYVQLHNGEERYKQAHAEAVKGEGGLRRYAERASPLLARALSGEHYRAGMDPMNPEARLGRWEEYLAGTRQATELLESAGKTGQSMEEWLAGQPTYEDYIQNDPANAHLNSLYREARSTLDWVRDMAVKNNWAFRQAREEQRRSAIMAEQAANAGNVEAAERHAADSEEAAARANQIREDWGIEDYFSHLFEHEQKRFIPNWFRRQMPREVYSRFMEGRKDWALGWLEDMDQVYWTYLRNMLRKVYLDRALAETEGLIEGEWNPVTFDGEGFRGINDQPLYERSGSQRRLAELPERIAKRRIEKGDYLSFYHRSILWRGEVANYEVRATAPGQKVLEIYREVPAGRKDSTNAETKSPRRSRDILASIPYGDARGMVAYAKTGGLKQLWPGTRTQKFYEGWLEHVLGRREHGWSQQIADGLASWLYHARIGFLSFTAAENNSLGGMAMNLYKLGPYRTLRGLFGLSRGKWRQALQDGGILTPTQTHVTETLARGFQSGRYKPGVQAAALRAAGSAQMAGSRTSMALFAATEWLNRSVAYLGGYIPAREAGLKVPAAQIEALRAVGKTQFHYDGVNTPAILWDPRLRAALMFSGYGLRFANTFGLDVFRSVRATREGLGAREADIHAYRRLLRGAGAAWATIELWQLATQAIQRVWMGDEEAEGMDAQSLFLTKVKDFPVVGDAWMPIAMQIEQATGADLSGAAVPLLLPWGFGPPMDLVSESWDAFLAAAKGDPDAYRDYQYRAGRILIPTTLQRFMVLSDTDISDDPSAVQRAVDETQMQIRGIVPPGVFPEVQKSYGAFRLAWDRERPYTILDPTGRTPEWHVSGPETWSRFLFAGQYQSGERSAGPEAVIEEWMTENQRTAFRRSVVRELAWDYFKTSSEGRFEEADRILAEIQAKGAEYGVTVDNDFFKAAERDWPLRSMPQFFRLAYHTAADRTELWEALLRFKETDAITDQQFYEAIAVLQEGREGFGRWLAEDPDNWQRFERAWTEAETSRISLESAGAVKGQ